MMRPDSIKKAYESGKTLMAIAEKDGRSVDSIRKILMEQDVKMRRPGRHADVKRHKAILAALSKGKSFRQVADQFGISSAAVSHHVHRGKPT